MKKISQLLENLFPLLKNMFIPALLTGSGLIWFLASESIPLASQLTLHHAFYILSFIAFLILLYFNQSKTIFFLLTMTMSYVLINYIKFQQPHNFFETSAYRNLLFFVPLNLILFYFLPAGKLLCRRNVYLLLAVMAEFSIGEHLLRHNVILDLPYCQAPHSLTCLSTVFFLCAIVAFFTRSIATGHILDYSLFFATLNILFGFYFSDNASALTIFFSLGILILLLAVIQDIYYCTYKDPSTGFASRNAFIIQSPKFPLKYSVGIISIDNYENLHKAFGKRGRGQLLKMIALRLNSCESEAIIYRYAEDELVLIFKNEDKNSAYEKMEKIRRSVASAQFVLSSFKKPVKLTISGSVSEKKRSDANTFEVLLRTRKALQKTSAFSCNVTSKA